MCLCVKLATLKTLSPKQNFIKYTNIEKDNGLEQNKHKKEEITILAIGYSLEKNSSNSTLYIMYIRI